MAKRVELATMSFPSQKEAAEFFRRILNSYMPGDAVNAADAAHLAALIERHHKRDQKVGWGIAGFKVAKVPDYGTMCFKLVRTDGSETDFSYLTCIKGASRHEQEVAEAFRAAIRPDLLDARARFFAEHADSEGYVACAVTKARIRPEHGHMDHRPPETFQVIVRHFLASQGLEAHQVPIVNGADNQYLARITDDGLVAKFRAYHAKVANLDFVAKGVNLSQSSKHRIKQGRIKLAT